MLHRFKETSALTISRLLLSLEFLSRTAILDEKNSRYWWLGTSAGGRLLEFELALLIRVGKEEGAKRATGGGYFGAHCI